MNHPLDDIVKVVHISVGVYGRHQSVELYKHNKIIPAWTRMMSQLITCNKHVHAYLPYQNYLG